MSELLAKAIQVLSGTVNISTGLAHPFDEARAKELLVALHAHGETLDPESVRELALKNHWPERHAKALADLARRIGNGNRVVIQHPRDWGEPTVLRLLEEIQKDK